MAKRGFIRAVGVIFIGILVITVLAVTALLFISGIFEKPAYLAPWDKEYAQKYDDPRIRLTAHGLLAANGHNMQPWKIRLDKEDPAAFYLYADSDRVTNEVDPYARQLMITQGAFLEYIKVAGSESGDQAAIELFPQGSYDEQNPEESMRDKPVAKITVAKAAAQSDPLYDYMFLPDTNRAPYQSTKLTSEQMSELENINADDTMLIKIFQDKESVEKLGSYAMKAAAVEAGVDRVMKETENIFRANEYQKNNYRYGFSVEGQGTSGIKKHLMQGLVTLFPSMNRGKAASNTFIQSTQASVDNTPAYAMIITKDNSRSSQVKSGMLYSKLILTAQQQGLVMQPLSQALEEYPEMNELYSGIHRDFAAEGETIQMLVRLGKPTKDVPLSMRREVTDLIVHE